MKRFYKKLFKSSLVLASIFAFASARAQAQHELSGSTDAGYRFTKIDNDSDHLVGGDVGYDYAINEMIQVGLSLASSYFRESSSFWAWSNSFMVGPTLNFGGELREAAFVGLSVGANYVKYKRGSDTDLAISVRAGKRFSFGESLTFKPYVAYTYTNLDPDPLHSFAVVPLSLSVIF